MDSEKLWSDSLFLPYQTILNNLSHGGKILEIGCGNAAVLSHLPQIKENYHGLDFSEKLIQSNTTKFPEAKFKRISNSNCFPFEDNFFDIVFNVFVIEHVIFPARFLKEKIRIERAESICFRYKSVA